MNDDGRDERGPGRVRTRDDCGLWFFSLGRQTDRQTDRHTLYSLKIHPSRLTLAEDDVAAIEPGAGHRGDEELGAVGVGARVGHGEQARGRVLRREVLVGDC